MSWMEKKALFDVRPIDSIKVGTRFRKDLGDIDALAGSIREVGLLHPVVIAADGSPIAGQRRLEACKRLGWREVPVWVVNVARVIRGEYAENVVRKDFLPSETVAITRALTIAERKAAEARQRATRFTGNSQAGSLFSADKCCILSSGLSPLNSSSNRLDLDVSKSRFSRKTI